LLDRQDDRLFFAGIIVIAANAGGAWTPIGDVTTTMLWIGGQITTLSIMKGLFIPSLINMIVTLLITSHLLKGKMVISPLKVENGGLPETTSLERNLMFFLGLGILLVGEIIHHSKDEDEKEHLTLVHALMNIDMSSVVFLSAFSCPWQRLSTPTFWPGLPHGLMPLSVART
jgi:Na+/H+ antiporter NhaD/arsenite permease-like protein